MHKTCFRLRRVGIVFIGTIILLCSFFPAETRAEDYISLVSPAVILVEQSTGKTLYAKNERARMYPASMTKILTALVAADYLDPDAVITVGNEIYGLPPDYNTAIHGEGETITVRNLLRALMIRSGNETGCILALNVIRARENRQNIPYSDAERLFCQLMNEKARTLGALDSNFNNPYGFHSENHYTTAYDLALICRAYMENDLLRQIAGEREYIGDSLDGHTAENAKTREYDWVNHNELLLGGANAYPYATGIKTGFTDEAGDCLSASASKKGIELVAVIFNSPSPGRWQDARMLFDYGFGTYDFEVVQQKDEELDIAPIANPRLGDSGQLKVLADDDAQKLLSKDELSRIQRVITYDDAVLDKSENASGRSLQTPIEQGAKLGTVTYTLDGEVIFTGTFRAAEAVTERTFDSDMDYYISQFKDNVFTIKALPYWFGGVGLLVGIIGIAAALAGRSRRRRERDRWRGSRGVGRYDRYR